MAENWGKSSKYPKPYSLYWIYPQISFKVFQKAKSILLRHRLLLQGFIFPNLANKYKTIFMEKRGNRWNSLKTSRLYQSFLKMCFKFSQKHNSNLLSDWVLVQGFIMIDLVYNYKTIFLEKQGKPLNSPKAF